MSPVLQVMSPVLQVMSPGLSSVAEQLTHLQRLKMVQETVEVIMLKPNGQNWLAWRADTLKCAKSQRVANYLAGTPPDSYKYFLDGIARHLIECTVPRTILKQLRHFKIARECMDYLTTRFDSTHCQDTYGNCHTNARSTTKRVTTDDGVGKMGETPHGRDDKAAAAMGPGMKTMDHQKTDGISLATLVSGPRDDQKVALDLVKPPPSPPSVASTTPPKWIQPHTKESHGMGRAVAGRNNDDGKSAPTTQCTERTCPWMKPLPVRQRARPQMQPHHIPTRPRPLRTKATTR